MKTLAIITTHPIQYNAPLFKLLHERKVIKPVVFYTWGDEVLKNKYDHGFGKDIQWDIPLLEGYEYRFPKNVANLKGSATYRGIDNPELIRNLEHLKPDAILIYGWKFKSHLAVMRRFHKKIPIFFRGDSTMMKEEGLKRILKRVLLSFVYRNVDYFLYAGKMNRQYFELAGAKPGKLLFMPHAVDNDRFAASHYEAEAEIMRMGLSIPPTAIVFLYAGKIDENKNVGLLLKAFTILERENTFLVIAGEGSTKARLLSEYGNHDRIKFLPFQNQAGMPVIYRLGNVFVLPSLSETWGLSINESFACSRPVICSDNCGAASDLVQNNVTGFVFRNNNVKDLVEKLKAISNIDVAQKLGKNAFRLIKEWNFATAAQAIERITLNATNSSAT